MLRMHLSLGLIVQMFLGFVTIFSIPCREREREREKEVMLMWGLNFKVTELGTHGIDSFKNHHQFLR
jgi:hypothetical protein